MATSTLLTYKNETTTINVHTATTDDETQKQTFANHIMSSFIPPPTTMNFHHSNVSYDSSNNSSDAWLSNSDESLILELSEQDLQDYENVQSDKSHLIEAQQAAINSLREEMVGKDVVIQVLQNQFDSLLRMYNHLKTEHLRATQIVVEQTQAAEEARRELIITLERLPKKKILVHQKNKMQKKRRPYDSYTSKFDFK